MVAGVQDALTYFTEHYGPYQHEILRIVEFPRFSRGGGFAESFPNSVPFNEAIGFTAKVDDRDPKDVDYQWWAHQEVPGNVQGAEFITESLSEYSALMVLKHKYGDERMRRFLRYELDRYLAGRGMEQKGEQPLLRADGAAYVHYQKGALVLYALQDAIGEAAMNDALSAFLTRWRFKGPPYATSRDLIAELRRVTPPEHQGLIEDYFETITLFDDRAVSARATDRGGGRQQRAGVERGEEIRRIERGLTTAFGRGRRTGGRRIAPGDGGGIQAVPPLVGAQAGGAENQQGQYNFTEGRHGQGIEALNLRFEI
jgi:hypothetical protein